MRSLPFVFLFSSLFLTFSLTTQAQESHVILITIDGFRPDFYLDPSWNAVNLRNVMNEGSYATGVNSVFPSVTYPSHTSMITGAYPARHGIYFNAPFEPESSTGEWNFYFKKMKSETLWEAAKDQGLTVASVFWPVSVGAPVDYLIPVIRPVNNDVTQLALTERSSAPSGLLKEVVEEATGSLSNEDLQNDDNTARISAYLIKKYQPNLMTIHLVDVDHQEHAFGRDAFEVRQAVATADHAVGVILKALDAAGIRENSTIIITGDHGFVNKHTMIAPNVWLSEAGLGGDDWKARFHSMGGSTFLFLKDSKDHKTLERIQSLLSDLPDKTRSLFRIIDKEELKQIGAAPDASLALAAIQGISFGNQQAGEVMRSTSGGGHGYYPDFAEIRTGFIVSGRGIRQGMNIPIMGVVDIAPLVAALLHLEFNAPDGRLYPGLLMQK